MSNAVPGFEVQMDSEEAMELRDVLSEPRTAKALTAYYKALRDKAMQVCAQIGISERDADLARGEIALLKRLMTARTRLVGQIGLSAPKS